MMVGHTSIGKNRGAGPAKRPKPNLGPAARVSVAGATRASPPALVERRRTSARQLVSSSSVRVATVVIARLSVRQPGPADL